MASKKVSTWRRIIDFISLMKLDLCLLLFGIANNLQNVTVVQLAEDKMCINNLNKTVLECLTITEKHNQEDSALEIVTHADDIKKWQFFIMNVPGTIISGFLGYWLDKYPHYLKFMVLLTLSAETLQSIILLVNAYAFSINSYFILLAYVPFALGGGMFLIYGACYTYVAWSTPPELLIIRFAFMEFVNMSAGFIGTFISGKILVMDPWFSDQARNYIGVLGLSTILLLITLLLASLFKLKNMPTATPENAARPLCGVIRDVFKFSRLNDLFSTFFKRRPNAGRPRLLLLVLSGTLCLGAFHGEETIGYQYAQRVYGWSAEKYSTLYSLLSIIPALATSLGPHILKSFLCLSDSLIGILGTISVFTMNLIHGVVLTPYGFILTYITGALHRVSFVAFRSLISTMVDSCEAAKIFTLITVFDSYGALGSAFLYTNVFNKTMQNNPGLIFIIAASILTIPVLTCIWLEITRSKWEPKEPTEKEHIYTQKSHPENAINDNHNSPSLMKIKSLTIVNVSEKF